MNTISIIENIYGIKRLVQVDAITFHRGIEQYCYKDFDPKVGNFRVFAFVLNDNSNNFFAELLSNLKFVKNFDKEIRPKVSVFWCEPDIQDQELKYSHYGEINTDHYKRPDRIWNKLLLKLEKQLGMLEKDNISVFPALLLVSVEKIIKNNEPFYPIKSICYFGIKQNSYFDNVIQFEKAFLDMFSKIVAIIPANLRFNRSVMRSFADLKKENANVISTFGKIEIDKYKYLSDITEDIFDDI